MKNKETKLCIVIAILTTILFVLITSTIIMMGTDITNNHHSRVAMITEINEENNLITATCGNGNAFSFYDTSGDWMLGDLCSLIMYDNGTEIVSDDKVVSARYGGYVELFEEIEDEIK